MGAACRGATTILNSTFEANGTGVTYSPAASSGHALRNNVFTNQTVAAATCGGATFASRDYHVFFGTETNGHCE